MPEKEPDAADDSEARARKTVAEIEYFLIFFAIVFVSYLIHVYFLVTAKKKELAEL